MMWRPLTILTLLVAATGCRSYAQTCDGNCYSSGDPHYQTFDCQRFEYHGKCSYTLMETCNSTMPYFEIISDNERMRYHPKYAITKRIIIRTTDEEIELTAEKDIFYNGIKQTNAMIEINNGSGTITKKDKEIVVESSYGFTVRWGSPFKAEINITNDNLRGNICGICGNANGDFDDDLVTPTNKKIEDFILFGDSWNAEENCGPCDDCRGDVCSSRPDDVVKEAHTQCEIFTDKKGKLGECMTALPSTYHHHLCVTEMCESLPDDEPLCDTLTDYLDICQSYGIFVGQNATDFIADCNPEVKCPSIDQIPNGGFMPDDSNFTLGSVLTFDCDSNYTLNGSTILTCLDDKNWSGDVPTCEAKCPSIDQIPNGSFMPDDSNFIPGSVLTFDCDPNYRLYGSTILTCLNDKKWSGDVPTCEADVAGP